MLLTRRRPPLLVERHVAVERFWEELPAVCLALEMMAEWQDRRTSSQAANVLTAVTQGEFLVGVAVAQRLFCGPPPARHSSPGERMDLVRCLGLVDTTVSVLEEMRTNADTEFRTLMEDAAAMASELRTEIRKPRLPGRAAHRSTAAGGLSTEDYYRVNAFVPAVEAVVTNIKDRFGTHQKTAFLLTRLLPQIAADVTWEQLEPVFRQYASVVGHCTEQLRAELRVWTTMWSNRPVTETPVTAIGALNECSQSQFPAIHQLLKVLAVLPVTTAEAERLFSKVSRTLTVLRSTMSEDRLEALILLQVHRDRLPVTDLVVDRFAACGSRRLDCRLPLGR